FRRRYGPGPVVLRAFSSWTSVPSECRPSGLARQECGGLTQRPGPVCQAWVIPKARPGQFGSVLTPSTAVTRGLDPRVHLLRIKFVRKRWIAGGSPATPGGEV